MRRSSLGIVVLALLAGGCRDRKIKTESTAPPPSDDAGAAFVPVSALAFPALDVETATRLRIDDGVTVVDLVRRDGGWFMDTPDAGSANENSVRGALAELSRCEWPTETAAPIAPSPEATELAVTVWANDIIVADLRIGMHGTARLPTERHHRTLYRLNRYTFDRPLANWRVRSLTYLNTSDIESAEIRPAGAPAVLLEGEELETLRRLLAGTEGDDFVSEPKTSVNYLVVLRTATESETLSIYLPREGDATVRTNEGRFLSLSRLIAVKLTEDFTFPR